MNALLVDTGCANERSVRRALENVGLDCDRAVDTAQVESADFVVLPGVGSFGSAMRRIREQGLDAALSARIVERRPTLAICVGLQLLTQGSEEAPDTPGLGVLDATVRRFDSGTRTPHMGWNRVRSAWMEPGFAYFANSFRIDADAFTSNGGGGWEVATTRHGGRFVAALRSGGVMACQFHPELSGTWGESVLRRWVADATNGGSSC